MALWHWQHPGVSAKERPATGLLKLKFADLAGWAEDDHAFALAVFKKSCVKLAARPHPAGRSDQSPLGPVCEKAARLAENVSRDAARDFFEQVFDPYRVASADASSLLTGYFEPELSGSSEPSGAFSVPVYRKPPDLVLLRDAGGKGLSPDLTAARQTGGGFAPYFTRGEIEAGALKGQGLEILYLADPVDAFVMHVQGSGLIRMADNSTMRLGFAAKNGHPYTSIGRLLVERGELVKDRVSLAAVLTWLRADQARGQALMRENKSYIFFRRLSAEEARQGPQGALGVALTAGRSLAVDPRYHNLGTPIWVNSPALRDEKGSNFARLMIAQDTGSAIKGPVRGDIYWGSGAEAGAIAGGTKHGCEFFALLPKP